MLLACKASFGGQVATAMTAACLCSPHVVRLLELLVTAILRHSDPPIADCVSNSTNSCIGSSKALATFALRLSVPVVEALQQSLPSAAPLLPVEHLPGPSHLRFPTPYSPYLSRSCFKYGSIITLLVIILSFPWTKLLAGNYGSYHTSSSSRAQALNGRPHLSTAGTGRSWLYSPKAQAHSYRFWS